MIIILKYHRLTHLHYIAYFKCYILIFLNIICVCCWKVIYYGVKFHKEVPSSY